MLINNIIQSYEQNNVWFLKITWKTQYYFFYNTLKKRVYYIKISKEYKSPKETRSLLSFLKKDVVPEPV